MPSNYKDSKLIIKRLRDLHAKGKTNTLTNKLLFSPTRPREELYLYNHDQWQTKNLAENKKYEKTLTELRKNLAQWIDTNWRSRT